MTVVPQRYTHRGQYYSVAIPRNEKNFNGKTPVISYKESIICYGK